VVTYGEPGSALGRAGHLWPLRCLWHAGSAGWLGWLLAGFFQPWDQPAGVSLAPGGAVRGAPCAWGCLRDAGFLEERGVFLWLLDMRKFQCGAHASEKLATLSLRLCRQSAAELRLTLADGGVHPCCRSNRLLVRVGVRVKQVIQEAVCLCENQTGSLTCLFPTLLVTNQFAR